MNAAAAHLGLQESHFVNPNGLHDPAHVSSARDMAMIGRALLKEFPDHADLFSIGAIQLGNQIITNHNGLLGHYPGADGMKTGFTCAAGFNVVASANHNGRRLIVVVLGSPSARERTMKAAQLFDLGFAKWGGGPTLDSLPTSAQTEAPDMHGDICSRRNRAAIAAAEEELAATAASVGFGAARAGRAASPSLRRRSLPGSSCRAGAFRPGPGLRRPDPGLERPGARMLGDRRPGAGRQGRGKAGRSRRTRRRRRSIAACARGLAAPAHVREAVHPKPARRGGKTRPSEAGAPRSRPKHDAKKSAAQ